jgi:hypothetical protein
VFCFNNTPSGQVPCCASRRRTGIHGHHHLLIDVEKLPDLDKPIPVDKHHKHFGKGQTEALIELSPGTHNLQLMLGDFSHVPHDTAITSNTITINVVK